VKLSLNLTFDGLELMRVAFTRRTWLVRKCAIASSDQIDTSPCTVFRALPWTKNLTLKPGLTPTPTLIMQQLYSATAHRAKKPYVIDNLTTPTLSQHRSTPHSATSNSQRSTGPTPQNFTTYYNFLLRNEYCGHGLC
jgi:hypothetical protein